MSGTKKVKNHNKISERCTNDFGKLMRLVVKMRPNIRQSERKCGFKVITPKTKAYTFMNATIEN